MRREGLCLALSLALHAVLGQLPAPIALEVPPLASTTPAVKTLGPPIPVVTLPPPPDTAELPLPIEGLVVQALPAQPLREIDLAPQGLPPPITLEVPTDLAPVDTAPPPPPPPPQAALPPPPPPADPVAPPAPETVDPFGQRLAAAYSEYGFDRVLHRQIAPPDAPVPPEKRELGIDWIEPDPEQAVGKQGTVTVLLIVAPDGTVERELIDSEGDRDLVALARNTAAQYRFAPLTEPDEQGKYRFITVKYVFAPDPPVSL